jgi:molybdopterin-containing oxidoreductase family membrane subunit
MPARGDDTGPIVDPAATMQSITAAVSDPVLESSTPLWWWLAFGVAVALLGLFVVALGWLFIAGVGIWGINIPVAWGFAIANYVWWVGMASGGTLISALFFLTRSEWRTAINRIAETMTLFAIAAAGIMPIIHLGRFWYFYWLFPFPNSMGLWPQFRSPLLWDFFAILCYAIASTLFWYVGLLPDLATLRDRARGRGRQLLYGVLALGWQGSSSQWRHYRAAYLTLAALMAPLVVSVHSIVGLDFAGGLSPGWHSTQFPPFFVFGAALSGFAIVLLLVIPLRRGLGLQALITPRHLEVLAQLLLACSLLVGYAYLLEAALPFYGGDRTEMRLVLDRFTGFYAPVYWATILLNVMVPQLLWAPRLRRANLPLLTISLGVVAGMWLERYLIVVQSLHRDFLPSSWGLFRPTFWDIATLLGSAGLFLAGFLLLLRFLPAVSMFEMRRLVQQRGARG